MADQQNQPSAQDLARASVGGVKADASAEERERAAGAKPAWQENAVKQLEKWVEDHIRNSALATRVDLYNQVHGAVQQIKQAISNA
jgi:hypothetical protein